MAMAPNAGSIPLETSDPPNFPDLTEATWRWLVWSKLASIEEQAKATNGRVTKLERFAYMAGGGLTVLTALYVPQFLDLLSK